MINPEEQRAAIDAMPDGIWKHRALRQWNADNVPGWLDQHGAQLAAIEQAEASAAAGEAAGIATMIDPSAKAAAQHEWAAANVRGWAEANGASDVRISDDDWLDMIQTFLWKMWVGAAGHNPPAE
ncbi:MAG: hypothetical protein K2Y20_13815 [Sphingomonas sp.]|nr:hypothetical protein [Sphingomonas sp.]